MFGIRFFSLKNMEADVVVVFGNMECTSIFGHMEVHAICFFTEVFIPPKTNFD